MVINREEVTPILNKIKLGLTKKSLEETEQAFNSLLELFSPDPYKATRRFLYGKDALAKQENREALVMTTHKQDSSWPYAKQTLEDCKTYLSVSYLYDPLYVTEKNDFYKTLNEI
jgi:hypothetical protein